MATNQGANAEAIQFHYDTSNDFFSLWLDDGMFYSCARWLDGDETLSRAQFNKLAWYYDRMDLAAGSGLLDIGCGWGGALREAIARQPGIDHQGITLSKEQLQHCQSDAGGNLNAALLDWCDLPADKTYSNIISVEAFEAFAKPDLSKQQRIDAYRGFFETCHRVLAPGGKLGLQTIYLETARSTDTPEFLQKHIFPDSALPELSDVFSAIEGLFSLQDAENAAYDYYRTCRAWQKNMRRRKAEIVDRFGVELYDRFHTYIAMSLIGFHQKTAGLLRLMLTRV
ncbi:MAG: cyclopropane-fatty-acyl-phospholipid synthase [Alcanivoracaceae bacterium]|nr:cyclopropane-fatty-acyl-phospholipid synthase [Alcanivoracaceae bacterium]